MFEPYLPTHSSCCSPHRSRSGSPLGASAHSPHPPSLQRDPAIHTEYHPLLDGTPCDRLGNDLPPGAPPPPRDQLAADDYSPFSSQAEFELVEFLYAEEEMSAGKIDKLMAILKALYPDDDPPLADHKELYSLIDEIQQGDVPWQSFSVQYNGEQALDAVDNVAGPPWQCQQWEVWFRDPLKIMEQQLANPDFDGQIDYAPKRIFKRGKWQYTDVFSGNWAWKQADIIAEDDECHGAMFAPIVLGSDKMTVSVATGQTEFYPLYISPGNIHNSARHAHRNGVALLGFLAIPKTSQEHASDANFRKFRCQLFHDSLEHILSSLWPYMSQPWLTRCADGHYQHVIYGLGPYIADYPEQALLACIVQGWCARCTAPSDDLDRPSVHRSHQHTDTLLDTCTLKELWEEYGIVGDLLPFTASFPRADIHELISPDILHQIIKGTFKDHIVDWVEQYIKDAHSNAKALHILADIDRRIAAASPYPGLQHFHQGRGFKQWTGNDSKALMKVYLPAISGHVPPQMVQAVSALIEFCYIVRQSVIDEDTLAVLDATLLQFHANHKIFHQLGVQPDGFSLPRQHSLMHYRYLIQMFSAPNGLCSSITESKHIRAVKHPYRHSSCNKPLSQMLLTNQRMDKLVSAQVNFTMRGMMEGPSHIPFPAPPAPNHLVPDPEDGDPDEDAVNGPPSLSEVKLSKTRSTGVPHDVFELANYINQPQLPEFIRRFLYDRLNPNAEVDGAHVPLGSCPEFSSSVYVHSSARATFYAPSDLCGVGGMHQERIRSVKSWYGGPARQDCIFIANELDERGFRGLEVARVFLFFSFNFEGVNYPCALIQWFSRVGEEPCDETGLWMVRPDFYHHAPCLAVVHLDCMLRGAHLIGVAGDHFLPQEGFDFSHSLDAFKVFYVNKYIDYHAHETVF
ncbi:hypothetical protein L208DRAFT_1316457 [Tricholoma matsutake]|nr:hypothetical protein L208DRAFT_1316457 [Tricholoma matsutake 945]